MYVCVYVCIYTYMHIYIYIYTHTHISLYIYIYTYVYTPVCAYIYIYIYTLLLHVATYMFCPLLHNYYIDIGSHNLPQLGYTWKTHATVYMDEQLSMVLYIYIYTHVCMYIYIYIYVYIGSNQVLLLDHTWNTAYDCLLYDIRMITRVAITVIRITISSSVDITNI